MKVIDATRPDSVTVQERGAFRVIPRAEAEALGLVEPAPSAPVPYDDLPGLRWSSLKRILDSPLAYKLQRPIKSAALHAGTLAHMATLQPEILDTHTIVYDGRRDERTKAYQEVMAEADGRLIVRTDELDHARRMAEAVWCHPVSGPLMQQATGREVVRQWTERGRLMKAQIDILGGGLLLDLKTARTIEARPFGGAAWRYGYHGQLAHYASGLDGDPARGIIAVESDTYDVAVFWINPAEYYLGHDMRQRALDMLDACEASGEWPGRYTEAQMLPVPQYAYPDTDESEWGDWTEPQEET